MRNAAEAFSMVQALGLPVVRLKAPAAAVVLAHDMPR
jgi:hypothetical protein